MKDLILGEKVSTSALNIVDNPLLNTESGTYYLMIEGNAATINVLNKMV